MDRFIVGTGRCGSTLLSSMLAESPEVLSLFEFFNGLDVTRRFAPDPVSGRAFAALIAAEQPFVTAVLRRGYPVAEITYPFGPGARHRREDPLPWVLVSLLPRLDADPDRLFDAVLAFARALPTQHLAAHYRALFDWLRDRKHRSVWIERSGSSIDYVGALHEFFPAARFVHIHRDGREVALSMREHHAYRLPIAILYQPGGIPATGFELHAPPEPDDPITRLLESRPPIEYYGRYWSDQVERGFATLCRLPADRVHTLAFEDLVVNPRAALDDLCGFFELDREVAGWTERAVARVRGLPPARFDDLPAAERASLADACSRGESLLPRRRG